MLRHLPNFICLVRIALIWPTVVALQAGHYWTALVLVAVCAISDGLDGWLAKRATLREVADAYRRQVGAVGFGDRLLVSPDVASCYVLFRGAHPAEATAILRRLEASNIETRLWYGHGLHRHPYYSDVARDDLPVTDRIAPLTIGLPVAPDLPEAFIRRLVAALAPGVRGHC